MDIGDELARLQANAERRAVEQTAPLPGRDEEVTHDFLARMAAVRFPGLRVIEVWRLRSRRGRSAGLYKKTQLTVRGWVVCQGDPSDVGEPGMERVVLTPSADWYFGPRVVFGEERRPLEERLMTEQQLVSTLAQLIHSLAPE